MAVTYTLEPGYPSTGVIDVDEIKGIVDSLEAAEVAAVMSVHLPGDERLHYAGNALRYWVIYQPEREEDQPSLCRFVAGGGPSRDYLEDAIRAVIRLVLDAAHGVGKNIDVRSG